VFTGRLDSDPPNPALSVPHGGRLCCPSVFDSSPVVQVSRTRALEKVSLARVIWM